MRCPRCGYDDTRSTEINTRFHGWITFLSRELAMPWMKIKWQILLLALEIETEGGSPYPYTLNIVKTINPITGKTMECEVALPNPTHTTNNKMMMTACRAAEMWAAEKEIILPEKEE